MSPLLAVHIAAGIIAIVAGYVALYAGKGETLHRKSGMVFVYAMFAMASSAFVLSVVHAVRINVAMSVLTLYMVTTALLTVRDRPRRWDAVAMIVGSSAAVYLFGLGVEANSTPRGSIDGLPAAAAFVFGSIALAGVIGDARLLLGRIVQGAVRLRRHLWRMCFGTFVASGSFFLGQPEVFPEPMRSSGIRPILGLLPLAVMVYWLVRTRIRRRRASMVAA
jgi:uncharacterized membrane protein